MTTLTSLTGQPAPELRVENWLANTGPDGLRLADVEEPIIYLYNFQSWCPGCHSHGFPALVKVKEHLAATGREHLAKFIAVQTVFEGHDTNTADAARESVARHGLEDIALGHNSGEPPTVMADFRTRGTPWTVLIGPGPDRIVLGEGFQVDPDDVITAIDEFAAHIETTEGDPMTSNDKNELRQRLTDEQFYVTQEGGTERAFTGQYWDAKTSGTYTCIVCETPLFESNAKFDSGTGWPSFHSEIADGSVTRIVDKSHGMARTEARCASCDAHLGHVFPDGPAPTGERYCMNSASLNLEATEA